MSERSVMTLEIGGESSGAVAAADATAAALEKLNASSGSLASRLASIGMAVDASSGSLVKVSTAGAGAASGLTAVASSGGAAGAGASAAGAGASGASEHFARLFQETDRTGSGLRMIAGLGAVVLPAMLEASGASDSLASSFTKLTTAGLTGFAMGGMLGAGLGIATEAAGLLLAPTKELTPVQLAQQAATEAQARAAQDASMVFGAYGSGVGVSRGSVDQFAASLLTSNGVLQGTPMAANTASEGNRALAGALLMAVGGSDRAAESFHVTGTAALYLGESQSRAAAGASAMVGSLAEVAAMAQRAGESYAEYSREIGTQPFSNLAGSTPEGSNTPTYSGRAQGGGVSPGQIYAFQELGEREYFAPSVGGNVIPSGGMAPGDRGGGGGGASITSVTINNYGVIGVDNLDTMVLESVRRAQTTGLLRGYVAPAGG